MTTDWTMKGILESLDSRDTVFTLRVVLVDSAKEQ